MRFSSMRNTVLLLLIAVACALALAVLAARSFAADGPPAPPTEQPGDKPEEKPADQTNEEEKLIYKYEGRTLTAIDASGAEKWKKSVDNDIVNVVLEGEILLAITKKEVVLFTPLKGLQRWAFTMADVAKVEPRDTTIILSSASQVSVVNTESGKEAWKYRPPEPITTYTILDDRFMVVLTEKHVAAFSYDKGEPIANLYIDPRDKFVDAQVLGPILLLWFEREVRLRDTVHKKELPDIKMKDIEQMRGADLLQVLGDLGDMVTAPREGDKAAGLTLLALAKNKDGKLILAAGLESEDENTGNAAQDILAAMAEYAHGKEDFLRLATNGVLEQLAALDSGGSIEKAFYTVYYTKYSYELPDPAQTLTALVTLLHLGDKSAREHAIRALQSLTDNTFEFKSDESLRKRNEAIEKWRKWLSDNQAKFVWDIPARKIKIRE